ncbi:MAG: hypothetical protein ACRCYP_00910 [Alphaproteobacteria bacterium]
MSDKLVSAFFYTRSSFLGEDINPSTGEIASYTKNQEWVVYENRTLYKQSQTTSKSSALGDKFGENSISSKKGDWMESKYDIPKSAIAQQVYIPPNLPIDEALKEVFKFQEEYSSWRKKKTSEIQNLETKGTERDLYEEPLLKGILTKKDGELRLKKSFWEKYKEESFKEELKKLGASPFKGGGESGSAWILEDKNSSLKKLGLLTKEEIELLSVDYFMKDTKRGIVGDFSKKPEEANKELAKFISENDEINSKSLLNEINYELLSESLFSQDPYWGASEAPQKTVSLEHQTRYGFPVSDFAEEPDYAPGIRPNCQCTVYFQPKEL